MKPSDQTIILRHAHSGDLDLLRYWDEQPHIIVAAGDDDWGWPEELDRKPVWREQLIAELNGKPIGFVQIIDPAEEESHYWGDVPVHLRAIDIWIGEADYLGQGFGTVMMNQALEPCFADEKIAAVLIDPLVTNIRAHKFYEKIGFKFVEERIMPEDDLCRIYQLTREDWERTRSY